MLHEPAITKNLIIISRLLTDNNAIVEFQKYVCFVKDEYRIILLEGIARDGLYQIEGLTIVSASDKPYVLLASKSMSIINSKTGLISMFSQFNKSNTMYLFEVNTFQFCSP